MKQLLIIILWMCSLFHGCNLGNHSDESVPVVNIDTLRNFTAPVLFLHSETNTNRPYASYYAVFLEKTSRYRPEEVTDMIAYNDSLWVLVDGFLRLYCGRSGKLIREYNNIHSRKFTSFDLDTTNMKLYCLDAASNRQRITKLDPYRDSAERQIELPTDHRYLNVHYLGEEKVLLTIDRLSDPCTIILDMVSGISNRFGNEYERENLVLGSLDREDSLNLYHYPRYFISETPNGLLVKHILNDTVSLYTPQGIDQVFRLKTVKEESRNNSVKQRLHQNNMHNVLGFWKTDHYWILQHRVYDSKVHRNGLTWLDPDMGVHGDPCAKWDERVFWSYLVRNMGVFHLDGYGRIFMDKRNNRILKIHTYKQEPIHNQDHHRNEIYEKMYSMADYYRIEDRTSNILPEELKDESENGNMLVTCFLLKSFEE